MIKHRVDFTAQYVSVGRGNTIKGGTLNGYLLFENDATTEEMENLSAEELGSPCIAYIRTLKKFEKKAIQSITTELKY
jgi:hypothetical protein